MSDENTGAFEDLDTAGRPDARAADPRQRRRPTGRRIAAVATGTTIALGAGGIAWAATTPTPTPPASSTPADPYAAPGTPGEGAAPFTDPEGGWHAGGHGPGGSPFAGNPLGGTPLHGEQVVETADGVYETVATQRGTVDTISAAALTVTSEDGYRRTYTLTADSLTDERSGETVELAAGDEVMVVATVEGTEATVTHVVDLAALPAAGDESFSPHSRPDGAPDGGPDGGAGRGPEGVPSTPEATPSGAADGASADGTSA